LRRGQGQPELFEVVGNALGGVRHLGGLVTRAIQPHDQPEARELVAANTFNSRHFLDPCGLGSTRPKQVGTQYQCKQYQPCAKLLAMCLAELDGVGVGVHSRFTPRHDSAQL